MAKVSFRAKELNLALKEGKGLKYFLEKYDCSEEQVRDRICTLYSKNPKAANKILADLKANDKRNRNKECPQIKEIPEKEVEKNGESFNNNDIVSEPQLQEESLDELKIKEKALSDDVIKSEIAHKDLCQKRYEKLKLLRDIMARTGELKAELKTLDGKFKKTAQEANKIGEEMNKVATARREKCVELEKTRKEIEERSKVALYVYSSGDIECEIETNDDGSEELYDSLLKLEVCQEFRLKEIRTLAKVICIAKNSQDVVFEVVFDNNDLAAAYELVVAEQII